MKKSMLLIALVLTLLVILISACTSATTPTSEVVAPTTDSTTDEAVTSETAAPANDSTTAVDDEAVKALIEERCSGCHNTAIIYDANYDESRWSSVIDQMIQRGAVLSDAEKVQMIDWLLAQP